MLTISERKALHEHNSGLGHIGKQTYRSSSARSLVGDARPRAAGLHDGGVSSSWLVRLYLSLRLLRERLFTRRPWA